LIDDAIHDLNSSWFVKTEIFKRFVSQFSNHNMNTCIKYCWRFKAVFNILIISCFDL